MSSGERIVHELSMQSSTASVIANTERSVILVRSFLPATEGILEPGSHLKLGMCMSGGGEVIYGSGARSRKLHWRRGGILVTATHDNSEFESPDVDMIGLAIDLKKHIPPDSQNTPGALGNFSSQMMTDEVIKSVLLALWTTAEYHGTRGAFIDEGIEIILERIMKPNRGSSARNTAKPLSHRQLSHISEYVQSHLSHDIRVPELAAQLGMEPRHFSRALRAATDCAPYAYLLALRIKQAKKSLDMGRSVIDTALSVGYTNPSKFTSAFRRVVGCTPSAWKRRNA